MAKGASDLDPVAVFDLEGIVVGAGICQYQVIRSLPGKGPRRWRTDPKGWTMCGEQAMVVKFPEPYGYRVYCEEGHCYPAGEHTLPLTKYPTDMPR